MCGVRVKYDARLNKLHYNKSKDFAQIYALLSENKVDIDLYPRVRYFEIQGDRLYYKLSSGSVTLCVPEGNLVSVPDIPHKIPLREALVRECHDTPYGGHRGVNKTEAAMRAVFYWPNMQRTIGKYVRSCITCNRNKTMRTNKIGLHPNEVPRGPMHSVTLDFVTKLPKAGPGGAYTVVAVLVDRFSKKVFGIPMTER